MLVMSISPIHSWTVFLVAVEYFQEESLCMLNWTLFLWIQAGIKMLAGSNGVSSVSQRLIERIMKQIGVNPFRLATAKTAGISDGSEAR